MSGALDGLYTLTSTQGKLSLSATVVDEGGTETKLNNHMDAETIDYVKK